MCLTVAGFRFYNVYAHVRAHFVEIIQTRVAVVRAIRIVRAKTFARPTDSKSSRLLFRLDGLYTHVRIRA